VSVAPELCALFGHPRSMMPEVCPSAGRLAETRGVPGLPDHIPITGVAGDQQAALFGQDCTERGDAKCTFGTGAFMLMNVGTEPRFSSRGMLATVAWTLDTDGAHTTSYALEGSAFIAGALVQWLRDGMGLIAAAARVMWRRAGRALIATPADMEPLARSVPDSGGVTIVPALTGLGAPHWRGGAPRRLTPRQRGDPRDGHP